MVLDAMRALEYQIGLEYPGIWVVLRMFSNGNVYIDIPKMVASKFCSVQICDGPPNDELLRVSHSIRLWFDDNGFDFDAALEKSKAGAVDN